MTTQTRSKSSNQQLTPAQRELARRELAQRDVSEFAAYVDPYAASMYRQPHLQLIGRYLAAADDGTLWDNVPGRGKKLLIITSPPGHWKTSYISHKGLAWLVGRGAQRYQAGTGAPPEFWTASYSAALAEKNARIALETVRDNPRYQNVFPSVHVSRTVQSSAEWKIQGMPVSTVRAAGVGGSLTGYGGVGIIDDPIKDRVQAGSATTLAMIWDWWTDVARTRIRTGQWALIVMTRWADNDLVGRIVQHNKRHPGNDRIVYLRLPALAETEAERRRAAKMGLPYDAADPLGRQPGEALCPAIMTAEEHMATRQLHPVTHDALDQGVPVPAGGYLASGDKFLHLDAAPTADVRWVLATDWAITGREQAPKSRPDPDYTVATLLGLWTPNGNRQDARLILGGMWRAQAAPNEAKRLVADAAAEAARIVGRRMPIRSGQANADRLYLSDLRGWVEMLGWSIANLPKSKLRGDKVVRATPWLELLLAGRMYMLPGPWAETVKLSVTQFPNGAHDDIEDTISVGAAYFGMGHQSQRAASSSVNFYS